MSEETNAESQGRPPSRSSPVDSAVLSQQNTTNDEHNNDVVVAETKLNDGDDRVHDTEIDHDAVFDLANSIVDSLYTKDAEDSDPEDNGRRLSNDTGHSQAQRDVDEDDDYDFEFDQEDLIGNIVANAVESMEEGRQEEEGHAENEEGVDASNGSVVVDVSDVEEKESAEPNESEEKETEDNNNKQDAIKEDELDDVIANVFKEQFQLGEDDESHDGGSMNVDDEDKANGDVADVDEDEIKHVEDDTNQEEDRNMDLMDAINDALVQNMENIEQQSAKDAEHDVDEEVDEEYELNAAIADALKNTESALKEGNSNDSNVTNNSINNDDLVSVIQDIDMNDVMQSALNDGDHFTNDNNDDSAVGDFNANFELNTAIKEALLSVPKKSNELIPHRKNNRRVSFGKEKLDLSTELTNVISNALKESGLVNKDNVNEFDIESALKEVVSGVIEHNLVSRPQPVVESEDDKDSDYNWDDIMDNAFEMAMEYPNDLGFDVDENDHDNYIVGRQKVDTQTKGPNRGRINKKLDNRQQTVSQVKPIEHLNKSLKNRLPLPIAPSKISAIATVTNVLDSLKLEEIDVNDIFKLKSMKLDNIKRSVSSVLSSVMHSRSGTVKGEAPKEPLDEKEKLRHDNRERKKRWREFNMERNRDIDLKTRIIKRAHHLYPSPEHDEMRKEWVESEFVKRKEKRLQREQKKSIHVIDMKNFDAKDVLPFDSFFKNKNNLAKIVEIYNEMGGVVTEDKLLSNSADRTASVTSIATVIAASYLVEKEKNQWANINHQSDEDDEYSIIQSLVVSVDKYLKNKDLIPHVDYSNVDNALLGNWSVSMDGGITKKVVNPIVNVKPMKVAPINDGATFKVNLDDIKVHEPASFSQDDHNQRAYNKRMSNKMTAKFKHAGMMNKFGSFKKKMVEANKKKAKPLVINFEKFLTPNPPKSEVVRKRKGSFATHIINNIEPSLKKRLSEERDVMSMINDNNEFEIDYDDNIDMDDMDISNNIEEELKQLDNDSAKANLKMIEKQLNYQVQQMRAANGDGENDDDASDDGGNVDEDALASVVNQVVGALEENYREGLEDSEDVMEVDEGDINVEEEAEKSNENENENEGDDINLDSVIANAVQDLQDTMLDTGKTENDEEVPTEVDTRVEEIAKSDAVIVSDTEESKLVEHETASKNEVEKPEDLKSTEKEETGMNTIVVVDDFNSVEPVEVNNPIEKTNEPKVNKRKTKHRPVVKIPQIPLPQYGVPKPSNRTLKPPSLLKPIKRSASPTEEPVESTDNKIVSIKRPGAFRKPTALKKPGETTVNKIPRPFGRITPLKKL